MSIDREALEYHRRGMPGKIEVTPTKPLLTQRDLSLAYTPGVAAPVRAIAEDAEAVFDYTAKGNLVAVLTNGSAILGLGDLGALAAKPVMEGKGVLFKRFAGVDVFDIEIDTQDPDEIIRVGQLIAPTFGGINLEDIGAPDCFYIERELERTTDIPIFHDDQHGTAIISGAALLNALEIVDKRIDQIRIVVNGAGAAGIACAEFYVALGAERANIMLCDSRGVVFEGREQGMNEYKARFAGHTTARSLADAMQGADVFVGVSVRDVVSPEMLQSMAGDPIVFALANPDPEIEYELARATRDDVILATGRSDYPNQVNNVLGFPFIFRGALDVRATQVNTEMKVAAARALARLAHEDVPDRVLRAYGLESRRFDRDYIIPKPFDERVLPYVAQAVARAAMESGVARKQIDLEAYAERLVDLQDSGISIMRRVLRQARQAPKRVVFAEGEAPGILRAAWQLQRDGIARPVLLGRPEVIASNLESLQLPLEPEVIHPRRSERCRDYAEALHALRRRKGLTLDMAMEEVKQPNVYGALMVRLGDADAFLSGYSFRYNFPDVLRPALKIIGTRPSVRVISGVYIMIVRGRPYFFTDATVNTEIDAETLAEIALNAAAVAEEFDIQPSIAMLSYSNFGGVQTEETAMVRAAIDRVRARRPELAIDGEMMADTALSPERLDQVYPFSRVRRPNILVFPNLSAANVAYKLLHGLGGAEMIGPILRGMAQPVHVLSTGAEVRDIVNMAALAVVEAQGLAPATISGSTG